MVGLFSFRFLVHFWCQVGAGMPLLRWRVGMSVRCYRRIKCLSTHRFMLLTDLHLSDDPHTATAHALRWAVEQVNQQKPDFLAIGGDVTTFGTAASTAQFLTAIEHRSRPPHTGQRRTSQSRRCPPAQRPARA